MDDYERKTSDVKFPEGPVTDAGKNFLKKYADKYGEKTYLGKALKFCFDLFG